MKHTDYSCNMGEGEKCNGRRLTAILYLNSKWEAAHGGQLRLYEPPAADTDESAVLADVDPLEGRLILFWSDRRVPHEVLPAYRDRFSVTIWYFDEAEKDRARKNQASADMADIDHEKREQDKARDRERIEREIAGFEEQYQVTARIRTQGDWIKDSSCVGPGSPPEAPGLVRESAQRAVALDR